MNIFMMTGQPIPLQRYPPQKQGFSKALLIETRVQNMFKLTNVSRKAPLTKKKCTLCRVSFSRKNMTWRFAKSNELTY